MEIQLRGASVLVSSIASKQQMSKLNFVQLFIEFCGYFEIFVWATNNHSGCWQIESLPLKKQPVSCTRTLPSLWLFPLLKDIMVCTENRTQYFNLTRCYVHFTMCVWLQEPYLHMGRHLQGKPSPWWGVDTFLVSSLWLWKMFSKPSKM